MPSCNYPQHGDRIVTIDSVTSRQADILPFLVDANNQLCIQLAVERDHYRLKPLRSITVMEFACSEVGLLLSCIWRARVCCQCD